MSEWKKTEIGLIPENWDVIEFNKAVEIKQGQVDPTKEPYSDMLHIGPENITQNSGQLLELKTNKELRISSGNYYFTEEDILYSKIRPYFNKVALPLFEGTCSADVYPVRPKDKSFDKFFLFYYFLSEVFLRQVVSFQARTGIPKINRDQIGKTLLIKPPIKEQREITAVLCSLDRQIKNLRKQNETLEAIAQTLFKHWFVDFEFPNEDRKPYKSSGGEIVHSELGAIPAGWQVGKLVDFVIHIRDSLNPSEYPESFFAHYSIPAFDNEKKPVFEVGKSIKSIKYIIKENCILVSKLNPATPRIWDVSKLIHPKPICSTEFQVLQVGKKEYFEYIACFLTQEKFTRDLGQKASGTSGSHQRVKPSDILECTVLIPSTKAMSRFHLLTRGLLEKNRENLQQIQTLAQTRDVLLPRLMSGKLRIKL